MRSCCYQLATAFRTTKSRRFFLVKVMNQLIQPGIWRFGERVNVSRVMRANPSGVGLTLPSSCVMEVTLFDPLRPHHLPCQMQVRVKLSFVLSLD